MSSLKKQIRNLITLAYDYNLKKSEKILNQLQRQLQILTLVSDVSIFELTSMESVELFVCLDKLIADADPRSALSWKVISFFSHIIQSPSIRIAMRDDLSLLPIISQFAISKLSKDKMQKVLYLLQELSYGIEFEHLEAWILKFIPQLCSIIFEHDEGDPNMESAILTLNNLCRGNPPVVSVLRQCSERKQLLRMLTNLRNSSVRVKLLVSEIMIFINVDHSKLDTAQITQLLDLVFIAAKDGLSESDVTLVQLSADVLQQLMTRSDTQQAINTYREFGSSCIAVLDYAKCVNDTRCVCASLSLVASVVSSEQVVASMNVGDLFERVIFWLDDYNCSPGCQRLMSGLIFASNDSMLQKYLQPILEAVKQGLKSLNSASSLTACVVEFVCLSSWILELVCERDNTFLFAVAGGLPPPTLSATINIILQLPQLGQAKLDSDCENGLSNGCQSAMSAISTQTSSVSNFYALSTQSRNRENGIPSLRQKKSLMEKCSEAVVRILYLAKLLKSHNPEILVESREMLNSAQVMQHIVCCERSREIDLVSRATAVLCGDSIPNENLDFLTKAQISASQFGPMSHESAGLFSQQSSSISVVTVPSRTSSVPETAYPPSSQENIDKLLSKLNGTVEKKELTGIPLTDVMEFYEYKLAAMAHAEERILEEMAASDANNKRLKQQLQHTKAESDRLRALLLRFERSSALAASEASKQTEAVAQVQEEARAQRTKLIKEKTDLERDHASTRSDLGRVRRDVEERDSDIRLLHRRVTDCTTELTHTQETLRKEQEQKTRLIETVAKMEDESRKRKRDYDDLGKEKSNLDMMIRSQEELIAEKDACVDELTKTNSQLKRIQDMIHNMSSVK